jgi:hypothetical protein
VATRDVFTDEELDQLRRFPDISREELIRYFTLTAADEAFVVARHSAANRLGAAVQLCSLPWLGFVPDDVASAPPVAVARLSERLRIPVGDLAGYGDREQTRTDHLREVARYLGWRLAEELEWKELDEFLFARAMEHDPPKLLFRLGCEYLASSRVIRPGVVNVLMRVAAAREKARAETWQRVAHLVGPTRAAELDELLVVDPLLGFTRLHWLGRGATQPSPAAVTVELEKLRYLRSLDAHELDLSMLPAERRRFLAGLGRRLGAQQLVRRDPQRRYPILLTLLAQSAVDVLDEVLLLFDQSISARESHARQKMLEALAEQAKAGEDRQALLDDLLAVLIDVDVPDEQVGSLLRGLGMDRLRAAAAAKTARLPRDHGHLASLDASLSYLRQFAPQVLAAVRFDGGTEARSLLDAVAVLSGLYATGGRKVPDGAPTDFVPTRWRGYLEAAAAAGDVTAYRHYWELCVLLGLRDGLRCGDVFVPGSRRYADPASFLLTPAQWELQRSEFCQLVGKPPAAEVALAAAEDELNAALTELNGLLAAAGGVGAVRLSENGELVIPRLTAEFVPADADELRDALAAMLPRISVAALLVDLDARTGFLDSLIHAGGKVTRSGELKRNLIYVLIAEATNMGLTAMAEACGVPYDVLAWTSEWYLREETLRAANTTVVKSPPPPAAEPAVRSRCTVVLGWATVPHEGPLDHRTGDVALLRPRSGHQHLHPRLRPALHVRHEGDRGDRAGESLRAR